jgi:hypothetical protein
MLIPKQAHYTECTKVASHSCFEIALCVTRVEAAIEHFGGTWGPAHRGNP